MAKASAPKDEGFRKPDPKFARFMTEERSRNARDFLAGYRTFSRSAGQCAPHTRDDVLNLRRS